MKGWEIIEIEWRVLFGAMLGVICSFILPVYHFLLFTAFATICDLYSGWRASGERFKSRGVRRTIEKTILYMIAILLAHGFDEVYLNDTNYITFVIAGIIASTELLSVYENIERKTGAGLFTWVKEFLSKHGPTK